MLKDGPMHGYEIAAKIKDEDFGEWIDYGVSSVYQSLKKLESKGLLKTSEIRVGKAPPRMVYELRRKGKQELQEGLEKILGSLPAFHEDLNIALFAVDTLDKKTAIETLERQRALNAIKIKELEDILAEKEIKSSLGKRLIYERSLALYKAHSRWLFTAIFLIKRR